LKDLLAALAIAALLFSLGARIEVAEAQPLTITIKPDGSIDPESTAFQREGNTYVATADLNCSIYIQKGDITVNGVNHTIQGPGSSQNFIAITLMASNVTITNFRISGWKTGVYGAYNNNTITNNVFTNNNQGITIYAADYLVSKNSIYSCSIAVLVDSGALSSQGDNNFITQNQIAHNNWAFDILNSNGTTITKNNVTDNAVVLTLGTQNANITQTGFHIFYLNNFANNTKVLNIPFGGPFASSAPTISPAGNWDDGTVGNYYDDYSSKYPNASEIGNSGIGDTPYLIEHVVMWESDYANGTRKEGNTTLGAAIDHYPLTAPQNGSYGANPQPQSPSPSPTATLTPTLSPTSTPSPTVTSSPTATPTPTNSSSGNPTATVPEYPAWTILILFAMITFASLVYIRKKQ